MPSNSGFNNEYRLRGNRYVKREQYYQRKSLARIKNAPRLLFGPSPQIQSLNSVIKALFSYLDANQYSITMHRLRPSVRFVLTCSSLPSTMIPPPLAIEQLLAIWPRPDSNPRTNARKPPSSYKNQKRNDEHQSLRQDDYKSPSYNNPDLL